MNYSEYLSNFEKTLSNVHWLLKGQKISPGLAEIEFKQCIQMAKTQQRQVFVVGNGGSASVASHFVVDLVNVLSIHATTLHDPALLTCMTNDHGYENAFAQVLSKVARKGDLLIAISSSGQSKNILNAADQMIALGGQVISLSGFKEDNPLTQKGLHAYLPKAHYGLVEVGHMLLLHYMVDRLVSEMDAKS